MKKLALAMAAVVAVAFFVAPVMADHETVVIGDKPKGKLLGKFNMIGHPKNVDVLPQSADDSNGRAVMIPLKNATGPDAIVCEGEEILYADDTVPTFTDQEPTGAKIHFVAGDSFDIIDRDATDPDGATIQVPTTIQGGEPVLAVSIWIAIHGKPNTCLDIDAYAFDGSYYFFAGSVDLNRKTGKASFIRANFLFDVYYCEVDAGSCVDGTTEELSVFNSVFQDYFWNILNNGARQVEVRLYPITAEPGV